MDDATKFNRIFGGHQRRATYGGRLLIRDGNFVADLKARVSGLAARLNRERGGDWRIEFSPTRTDDLTERSLFDATLASPTRGERRLSVRIGRDWVEIGGPAMESAARGNGNNVQRALESAFRRAVLRSPSAAMDPSEARGVTA